MGKRAPGGSHDGIIMPEHNLVDIENQSVVERKPPTMSFHLALLLKECSIRASDLFEVKAQQKGNAPSCIYTINFTLSFLLHFLNMFCFSSKGVHLITSKL